MTNPDVPPPTSMFATGAMPPSLSADVAGSLLAAAGDIALVLAADGTVLDVAAAHGDLADHGVGHWIGHPWFDTVTIESRPKIAEMLADAAMPGTSARWRQVNHPAPGGDVPIRYLTIALGDADRLVAIGRDLRGAAAMQQRLLQTQQSLERDYVRLRQAETRYRLLFDMAAEPVLIADADTRRIREANPAAHRLVDAADGSLIGRPIHDLVDPRDRDDFIAHLGAAAATDEPAPVTVRLADRRGRAGIAARLFRQARASSLLVRMTAPEASASASDHDQTALADVVERMPDAFVLADRNLDVLAANAAFVELAELPAAERAIGRPLDTWLGRAGIDLDLVTAQLREHGAVRNVATILRGRAGGQEEVELAAVRAPGADGDCYGFVIRPVARRLRDAPAVPRDVPRSVEQLTELVGRMSLKEIVRESTDLIERLCIEAALEYTADNRASAAEILGVSRQSLYSKLHRHGLGNLVAGD